ncbi:hypothetical protein LJB42_002857 [Komagataella kurtzmanii]|nr:hypothetical protein LJB42_002857 [Komagataella kurtzmanii]
MDIAESLKDDQANHKELIESVPRDINFLENKYSSVNQAIHNDLNFVMSFKCKVLESFNDWVEKVIKLYLQLTNPVLLKEITNNDKTLNIKEAEPPNSAILHTFYVYKVKEIQQNIQKYHSVLQEIENAVDELDKVSSNGIDNSWNLIIQTLKEEFRLYLELANNLADVHHEIKRISTLKFDNVNCGVDVINQKIISVARQLKHPTDEIAKEVSLYGNKGKLACQHLAHSVSDTFSLLKDKAVDQQPKIIAAGEWIQKETVDTIDSTSDSVRYWWKSNEPLRRYWAKVGEDLGSDLRIQSVKLSNDLSNGVSRLLVDPLAATQL